MDRSLRIGVIGAGAAGLAAAEALARAGFRRVVVLEESARVGGKCSTFTHEGRAYELGAGALTTAYDNVRDLMKRYDVKAAPGASGLYVDADTGASTFVPPVVTWQSGLRLGLESAKLTAALASDRRLRRPGFAGLARELGLSFDDWARQKGVLGAGRLIEPWFTAFGYGYLDDIPAAYVLKYALLFRLPVYELLEVGYQGLWERVAKDLEVRLETGVTAVDRSGQSGAPVVVQTSRGRFDFDALILACPLARALAFLDADAEELDLFGAIRENDYHVVALKMDRGPNARYGFFPKHFDRHYAGEPVFFYRRFLESDLVLLYTLPAPGTSLQTSKERVLATVERVGWRAREVLSTHAWKYFPHVSSEVFRGGYYERLEARQGAKNTWLTGEICAFTTVESVTAYSRGLVEEHFAG